MKNDYHALPTQLAHKGRDPARYDGAVNPPVWHASTFLYPTLEQFQEKAPFPYKYGRYDTPTSEELKRVLCALEDATSVALYSTGLAAIAGIMETLVRPGDHLLVTDNAYNPVRVFCEKVLREKQVTIEYFPPRVAADIAAYIRPNTRLIWLESPGSQTFELQDVPAITAVARAHKILTVMDNTWGAGVYFRPLDHGVDISMQTLTKFACGCSDVLMGFAASRDPELDAQLKLYRDWYGHHCGGDDIRMILRGLRSMSARLRTHEENAYHIAEVLQEHPAVQRVIWPALPNHPDHAIWQRDFTGAASLFAFILKPKPSNKLNLMMDNMQLYGMGYSWGGYESLIIPFVPARDHDADTNVADLRKTVEHNGENAQTHAMRIYLGLEDKHDLARDLVAGLDRYWL